MTFLLGLILFLPLLFAQAFEYKLEGSFPYTSKTYDVITVDFKLAWNEEGGIIKGLYSDSLFTNASYASGTNDKIQREFHIMLPREVDGRYGLMISTRQTGDSNGTIPITVNIKDSFMMMGPMIFTSALMERKDITPLTLAENDCEDRFGALAGYCGSYNGAVTEDQDLNQLCHLTSYPGLFLEVSPDAQINLHISSAKHNLGTVPSNPLTPAINVVSRHCGPLFATTFTPGVCQILTLKGSFSKLGDKRTFSGKYMIRDESTGQGCIYGLSLDEIR